jgi:hypothetical protein
MSRRAGGIPRGKIESTVNTSRTRWNPDKERWEGGFGKRLLNEMGRAYSKNGAKRNTYRILVGKSEGKRPIGKPRQKWMDKIKMDLREIEWTGLIWLRIRTSGGLL